MEREKCKALQRYQDYIGAYFIEHNDKMFKEQTTDCCDSQLNQRQKNTCMHEKSAGEQALLKWENIRIIPLSIKMFYIIAYFSVIKETGLSFLIRNICTLQKEEEKEGYLIEKSQFSLQSLTIEGKEKPFYLLNKWEDRHYIKLIQYFVDMEMGTEFDGVWLGSLEKGYPLFLVGESILQTLGYTAKEFQEKTDAMMIRSIYPEDRPAFESIWNEDMDNQIEFQTRFCNQSGKTVLFFNRAKKIHIGNHKWGFVCLSRVISESKKPQQESVKAAQYLHNQENPMVLLENPAFHHKENDFNEDSICTLSTCERGEMQQQETVFYYTGDDNIPIEADFQGFPSLAKNIPCGVFIVCMDRDLTLLYGNDCFYELIGFSPMQMKLQLGNRLSALLYPEDIPDIAETISTAFYRKEKGFELEKRVFKSTGEVAWHLIKGNFVQEKSGRTVLHCTAIDITDRKRMEQNLKINEERLKIALKETENEIFDYYIAEKTMVVSEQFARRYGLSQVIRDIPHSLIKKGIVPKEDSLDFLKACYAIDFGEKYTSCNVRMKTREGNYVWNKIVLTTLLDEDGSPMRAIGIVEDITAQKEAELAYLKEEQYRSAMLSDAIADMEVNITQNTLERYRGVWCDSENSGDKCNYEEFLRATADKMIYSEDREQYLQLLSREHLMASFHRGIREIHSEHRRWNGQDSFIWVVTTIHLLQDPVTGEVKGVGYLKNIDKKKKKELLLQYQSQRDSLTGLYNKRTTEEMIKEFLLHSQEQQKYFLLIIDLDDFKNVNDRYGHMFGDWVLLEIAQKMRESFSFQDIMGRIGGDEFAILSKDIGGTDKIRELTARFCQLVSEIEGAQQSISCSVGISCYPEDGKTFEELYQKADIALYKAKNQGRNRFAFYEEWNQEYENDTTLEEEKMNSILENHDEQSHSVEYLQYHDDLTGLPNRRRYLQFVDDIQHYTSMGVISADINGLGIVNKLYGEAQGDQVILKTVDIFRGYVEDETIFRLYGDQFVLLCPNISYHDFLEKVSFMKQDLAVMNERGVSIGYTWSDTDIDIRGLARHAKEIMLLSKQKYYEKNKETNSHFRAKALQELQEEIQQGLFQVVFQPKMDIITGSVIGAEALVRKCNSEGGLISPVKFIPALEENKLIRYIDFFVLEHTCKVLQQWKNEGRDLVPISVNFSRLTLLEDGLVDSMEEIVSKYDLSSEYIEVEITETIGEMERETIAQIGESLKKKGYKIALDDFGTKYTNLSMLTIIDFDILKLDGSLVKGLKESKKNQVIVDSIVKMCNRIGIQIIAEGVETKEQKEMLRDLGCAFAQGYYYSQPISRSEFDKRYLC